MYIKHFKASNGEFITLSDGAITIEQQIERHKGRWGELTEISAEEAAAEIVRRNTPTLEQIEATVRAERDSRIQSVMWRYDRNAREVRLGLFVQDDISALDAYIQALADVPEQPAFPTDVAWPVEPEVLVQEETV